MEKIHIFTDSSSDIPKSQCDEYGIEIIPVTLTAGGRTLREYFDITPEEYWALLRENGEIPATAQVSPTQCLECYRRAREAGCTHVLGVLINAAGSGGFQSACIARELFYGEYGEEMQIELLDSRSYSYLYGHIVVEAARMRAEGESFAAITALAQSRLDRVEGFLGVYSLKHLKKSGRISGGAAFVGEALGLRPIAHVIDGRVDVVEKVRGDKSVAPRLAALALKNAVKPETQTAYILYAAVSEENISCAERLLLEGGFQKVRRSPIGASVTTNAGPQSIAIFYYGKLRK